MEEREKARAGLGPEVRAFLDGLAELIAEAIEAKQPARESSKERDRQEKQ